MKNRRNISIASDEISVIERILLPVSLVTPIYVKKDHWTIAIANITINGYSTHSPRMSVFNIADAVTQCEWAL